VDFGSPAASLFLLDQSPTHLAKNSPALKKFFGELEIIPDKDRPAEDSNAGNKRVSICVCVCARAFHFVSLCWAMCAHVSICV
jgi:hypothetical protein